MTHTILDCYTDEPAGLGVPPYLGVYPRYIAAKYKKVDYITIDDLRKYKFKQKKEINRKTNIRIYNTTNKDVKKILDKTKTLIVILGVHTPGKYLSAIPGTLKEVINLIKDIKCKKILTGPAVFGTQLEGGKFFEKANLEIFDEIKDYNFDLSGTTRHRHVVPEHAQKSLISDISDLKAKKGAYIINQIPDERVIEIETGRGCPRIKGCSFCLEPVKHKGAVFRKVDFILEEIKAFYDLGCRYFRLGKQSCFYSFPKIEELLKSIWQECPKIKVLHIDNANPAVVDEEKTKLIVKYCTSGNVAAFGVESFDEVVIEKNNLNSSQETTLKAIKIINNCGKERGNNGMPKLLPGINILFGLKGETKRTHERNMFYLKKILKENLLLRRINIRQVNIFPGTDLYKTVGNKFIKKNKKYYWKWRNEIRQKIDFNMLKKIVPKGTVLKDIRAEIYDGNTTFARQFGTYPLIVGIKERLELKKFYNVKITNHMLRSVVGDVVG